MNTSYAMLDHGLGEDLDMLRDVVSKFAQAEIAPRAADIDRDNEFPVDLWRKMGDLGILGVTVAEEFGGSNMGYLAHVIAMEEISRASASVAFLTAPTPTFASIKYTRTALLSKKLSTYRNSAPANTSAHSPCQNLALAQMSLA